MANNSGGAEHLSLYTGDKGRSVSVDASDRLQINAASPMIQLGSPAATGTLNLGARRQFDLVLDKNVVYTGFLNPIDGAKYLIVLQQDATGGRTVTWPSNVRWRGGTAPTLTSVANGVDAVTMTYNKRQDVLLAEFAGNFD